MACHTSATTRTPICTYLHALPVKAKTVVACCEHAQAEKVQAKRKVRAISQALHREQRARYSVSSPSSPPARSSNLVGACPCIHRQSEVMGPPDTTMLGTILLHVLARVLVRLELNAARKELRGIVGATRLRARIHKQCEKDAWRQRERLLAKAKIRLQLPAAGSRSAHLDADFPCGIEEVCIVRLERDRLFVKLECRVQVVPNRVPSPSGVAVVRRQGHAKLAAYGESCWRDRSRHCCA